MRSWPTLLLVAAAGCGTSNGNGNGDMTVAPDMTLPGTIIPLDIGPIPLASGEERTVCSTFRLPTSEAIDAIKIDATLAPGSHHLVFYRSAATVESKPIQDCPPLDISGGDTPVFIAETQSGNSMPLPTGAAFHFAAGQMIKLEAHYLNATQGTLMGMGSVQLTAAPPGGSYQPADIMFCGSVVALSQQVGSGVPPGDTTLPAGFWKPPAGVKVFGLTTHEHKRGTVMLLDKSTSTAAGSSLSIGQPYDNPPFKVYDDQHLITFAANEGFRWECRYHNSDATTYYFGQSAQSDEMCFFWAYYYPSVGHFIDGQSTPGCWQ